MLKKTSIALILSSLALTQAHADFSGYFSPLNWTFTQINSDGIVVTSGAPTNVVIFSGDNGSEGFGSTIFTIPAPSSGTVSFNWNYTTADGEASVDPFGYVQNGSFIPLTNPDLTAQTGSIAFAVLAGQTLGFQADTANNFGGPSSTTVSNFQFIPDGPEIPFGVDSTLGLSFLGLAAAWKLRRRKTA